MWVLEFRRDGCGGGGGDGDGGTGGVVVVMVMVVLVVRRVRRVKELLKRMPAECDGLKTNARRVEKNVAGDCRS